MLPLVDTVKISSRGRETVICIPKEKSLLQDASCGHRGWLKKSKLIVEEGATMVSVALAPTLMATKNINCSRDFQPRIGGRRERK